MLLSGSASAFLSSPGTGPGIVVLSGGGKVPATGSVDLSVVQAAATVPGVLGASPEVYAPVEVGGAVAVVRGVNLSEFASVQPISLVQGSLDPLGNATVYAGVGLARQLGLGVGAQVALRGVLSGSSADVRVAAIVSAGSPYDSELISSLQLARGLLGLSASAVTFDRLKVDPAVFNDTLLLRAIAKGSPQSGGAAGNAVVQQLQLAPTATLVSVFTSGVPAPSIESMLGRGVGVVQAAFEALDVVVLLASFLAVYFATSYWLESARPTSEALAALGMGRRMELGWHLGAAVPVSLLAGGAGFLAAYLGVRYLAAEGALEFFFQPVQVPLDPAALLISCVGPAAAVAASVVVGLASRRR